MTNVKLKMSNECRAIIRNALREDVGVGDITTSSIVASSAVVRAIIIAKEKGLVAGLLVAGEVFKQVDRKIKFTPKVKDGTRVKKGTTLATLSGPARGILTGERVALNFLQRLSGIATLTNKFVSMARGTKILDTRKTTPGLRALEKYAVRCGGGVNHRMGLYDAVLIKENHIALAGGIERAIEGINRVQKKKMVIEVETRSLSDVKRAIKAGVDRILLDNMSLRNIKEAARLCQVAKVETEASGGMTIEKVRLVAKAGVDYISVGALTHSPQALDISLLIKD